MRHAALDVFVDEPLPEGHPFTRLENVTLTSHAGYKTREASRRLLIMGLDLAHGGHLTHGHKLNFSGKTYHVVGYQVRREDERVRLARGVPLLPEEVEQRAAGAGPRGRAERLDELHLARDLARLGHGRLALARDYRDVAPAISDLFA